MESLKAIPTEYRGVRYRSKSEAMFARWLELDAEEAMVLPFGFKSFGFEYEPKGICVDGWSLDFLRWRVQSRENTATGLLIPTISYDFIEYKPSKPNATYLEVLGRRFRELQENLEFYDGLVCRSSFYCYYGSVFNNSRGRAQFDFSGSFCCDDDDWLDVFEEDIRDFRFDLEVSSCHE
jgi:hypothetical protein